MQVSVEKDALANALEKLRLQLSQKVTIEIREARKRLEEDQRNLEEEKKKLEQEKQRFTTELLRAESALSQQFGVNESSLSLKKSHSKAEPTTSIEKLSFPPNRELPQAPPILQQPGTIITDNDITKLFGTTTSSNPLAPAPTLTVANQFTSINSMRPLPSEVSKKEPSQNLENLPPPPSPSKPLPPCYIAPDEQHTATVIWLHGVGEDGDTWKNRILEAKKTVPLPHIKFTFPNA
jgi:hypothetical protein